MDHLTMNPGRHVSSHPPAYRLRFLSPRRVVHFSTMRRQFSLGTRQLVSPGINTSFTFAVHTALCISPLIWSGGEETPFGNYQINRHCFYFLGILLLCWVSPESPLNLHWAPTSACEWSRGFKTCLKIRKEQQLHHRENNRRETGLAWFDKSSSDRIWQADSFLIWNEHLITACVESPCKIQSKQVSTTSKVFENPVVVPTFTFFSVAIV